MTLSEMSTAKCPFKNAAAAIYAVCVSKEYPRLPEELSDEAVSFLGRCVSVMKCTMIKIYNVQCDMTSCCRCLVEDPCLRADTSELLAHPFCLDQVWLWPSHILPSQCSPVCCCGSTGLWRSSTGFQHPHALFSGTSPGLSRYREPRTGCIHSARLRF